jgi:hypothetical protein
VDQRIRVVLKTLGVLFLMALSGGACFIVSAFVLMQLGLHFHGTYDHYWENPILVLGPAIVGLALPLVTLRWLKGIGEGRRRNLLRTSVITIVLTVAVAVFFWALGMLGVI